MAQDLRCRQCGEIITTEWLKVDSSYYHKGHFLCDECRQTITGKFVRDNYKYYHLECFNKINGQFCDFCKKLITGELIYDGDKTYHSKCYFEEVIPKCNFCLKPIKTEIVKFEGKKYHRQCYNENIAPKCTFCGKPILDVSLIDEDKRYHEICYKENVAPRCVICSEPVFDEIMTDSRGNAYHSSHSDYPTCDNCSAIICEKSTGGGKKYDDGRILCNICVNSAVFDNAEITKIFNEVKEKLTRLGVDIPEKIEAEGVDRIQFKKVYTKFYSPEIKGFCKTVTEKELTNLEGKVKGKKKCTHKIYIINGIPQLFIAASVAHEMLHAWISENADNLPNEILEGCCNFATYLYLKDNTAPDAKFILKRLYANRSRLYGESYRKIHAEFADKPVINFLEFLKKEGG